MVVHLREYVEEANKAHVRMSEYLHFLNTNCSLYSAVIRVEKGEVLPQGESQRAASALRTDFEKGGIHLPSEKLERVNQLNMDIANLAREYNENIAIDPGFIDVFPALRIPRHMQPSLKPIYRQISQPSNKKLGLSSHSMEKGVRLTTDPASLSSILKWVSDPEVRRQAYMKGNTSPLANLSVIETLLSARHEHAQIMGCKSHAEFAIRLNMAVFPDVVIDFLLELSKVVHHKAAEEFKALQNFKRKICQEKTVDLDPWDEIYFTGMLKSSAYNLDSKVIASYFPLSHCLDGLNILVKYLFGATLLRIPLATGESWHPDVIKFALHHPQEGDLGYLYMDLYSRDGKYPSCAHFAIRGGRQLSEAEYQLPIVALVCNFSAPSGSFVPLLSHCEVETLFHEFGHALHSLLSRTAYQHFSGTRVLLDFAETPSNLFEYFAWDYNVLRTFARHHLTGEVIPEKLVEAMNHARQMCAATDLQRQIFYALADLTLHGEKAPTPGFAASAIAELRSQHTNFKHVEGTFWQIRFSHLINYPAGYYSYLYARCFSSTIWQKLFHKDPLSPAAGSALRTKLLQNGGAIDPSNLLKNLVGDGVLSCRPCGGVVPEVSSLIKELGL